MNARIAGLACLALVALALACRAEVRLWGQVRGKAPAKLEIAFGVFLWLVALRFIISLI